MPYYKRYYKKRNFRRNYKKRNFSRFNLYRKRSSKAQAYQIYRLNRKVNYLNNANKPEIKIFQPATDHIIDPMVSVDTVNGRGFHIYDVVSHSLAIFKGRYARLKDLTLTGGFKFEANQDSTKPTTTGCLRLVFFKTKRQIYPSPIVGDIFDDSQSAYSNEYYMRCPLNQGFSTKFTLLRDYKFYLRPGDMYKPKFIKLRIKLPFSLRRDRPLEDVSGQEADHDFPAGSVFCCAYICRAGGYTGAKLDAFSADINMKLAYIDDN